MPVNVYIYSLARDVRNKGSSQDIYDRIQIGQILFGIKIDNITGERGGCGSSPLRLALRNSLLKVKK